MVEPAIGVFSTNITLIKSNEKLYPLLFIPLSIPFKLPPTYKETTEWEDRETMRESQGPHAPCPLPFVPGISFRGKNIKRRYEQ